MSVLQKAARSSCLTYLLACQLAVGVGASSWNSHNHRHQTSDCTTPPDSGHLRSFCAIASDFPLFASKSKPATQQAASRLHLIEAIGSCEAITGIISCLWIRLRTSVRSRTTSGSAPYLGKAPFVLVL